jgi:hypothetical protein
LDLTIAGALCREFEPAHVCGGMAAISMMKETKSIEYASPHVFDDRSQPRLAGRPFQSQVIVSGIFKLRKYPCRFKVSEFMILSTHLSFWRCPRFDQDSKRPGKLFFGML